MKASIVAVFVALLLVPTELAGSPPGPSLEGRWAQMIVTTTISRLPIIGEVESVSRFYAMTRLEQKGEKLELSTTPCFVRIDGGAARVKTIVPQAMTQVMGPVRRRGTLDGRQVVFGRAVDVLGAELDDEWRGSLPASPDDARVIDEDGDGEPGVTVRVFGPVDGEIYLAQRTWNRLSGTVSDGASTIRGRVRWSSEQQVLGASSIFLKVNPRTRPHSDPNRSTFEMHRVRGSMTCEELVRAHESLFKR